MMPRAPKTISAAMGESHASYRAGQDSRFQSRLVGVDPSGSGADYHYRNERQFLHAIERCRDYQRNDPIVGQGVRRVVSNVIQGGFNLDVNTGSGELDQLLGQRWRDWATDADQCHSEGELTWHQMERMALSSVIVDGDVLALPLKDGSIQWVEAHRLRTPSNTTRNVIHGVLVDNAKRRKEYWIAKQALRLNQSIRRVADIKAYAARDRDGNRQVLHLYHPERFSQTRGVSCLLPVSETIGQHGDLQFATLVKAQLASLITIARERGADWKPSGIDAVYGEQYAENMGGYIRTIEAIGTGLEVASDPDEKIQVFAANIPSAQFFEHAMMILTFIAVNLDLPVAVLLLDPSNTNFSGWRGAIDQARTRFKQIQGWQIGAMHSPIYRWKVRQWIATDPEVAALAEQAGVDPFGHSWHPPTWSYIEPTKDVQSDVAQLEGMQNSPRGVLSSRGRNWETIVAETVADYRMAMVKGLDAAREINGAYAEANVTWRDFIKLPTAPTLTANDVVEPEQEETVANARPAKP